MSKDKMSILPRKPKSIENENLNSFIMGAEKDLIETLKPEMEFPWENPNVREDVMKIINVRLSEPYALKLDYLAKGMRISMHKICVKAVIAEIDKLLEKL